VAAALAAAGCGGGDDAATTGATGPAPAPAGTVTARVVDADTAEPLGGATVLAFRGREVVARATAAADGTAALPEGSRFAEARVPGRPPARARIAGPAVELGVFDPALQSPEYGGGPERDRFVPGAGPTGASRAARCSSSRPRWRTASSSSATTAAGSTRSSRRPASCAGRGAIAGEVVYVSSMDGALTAYTAGAGRELWTFSTGGSPIESSPLVVGGVVHVGAWNGRLYAVDARTGRARWTFSAEGDIKGSAALAAGRIVVADYAGNVHALDPSTGRERWAYRGGRRFYGGPAVSGDTIVIGDVGGAVIALDARDGSERWRHGTGGAFVYSTAAIARGTAFIGSYDGVFQALDLRTGAVRWSYDMGERISGSATVVGDVVYTATLFRRGGPRRTVGLDTQTGAVRFERAEGRYSPAVGAGRTLYLVGTRTLDAYRSP
jgi:outer membrane protein assembly factor BamB